MSIPSFSASFLALSEGLTWNPTTTAFDAAASRISDSDICPTAFRITSYNVCYTKLLRDSRKQFENGLPTSPLVVNVDTTVWGRVPNVQAVVHAFDNNIESRRYQDVGLDGLGNEDEVSFFDSYLQTVGAVVSPEVLDMIFKDPANDDFSYNFV